MLQEARVAFPVEHLSGFPIAPMKTRAAIASSCIVASSGTLPAADLTWDTGAGAGIQGGAGNWNSTETNWTTDGGTTRQAWSNLADTAVLSPPGAAIIVTETIQLAAIRSSGNSGGHTLSGATLDFGLAPGSIDTTSLTTGGSVFTIQNVITGSGGLSIAAGGSVVLTSSNTYTGSITVTQGTLSINSAWLADAADVTLAATATLNLYTAATDTIDELIIGGIAQSPGIYGALGSGAPFERSQITGSGKLLVILGPPLDYETWETENGITGAGAGADSDGDGVFNGIEFVIGGDPSGPGSDSNSQMPTITTDDDHMYFIYRRTDAAVAYDPFVEYSSSLAQWSLAEPGEDGVIIDEDSDFFGYGVTRVTVRLPRALASGSALFARLGVNITP
jgi:autotransporter-associated beta strand protein